MKYLPAFIVLGALAVPAHAETMHEGMRMPTMKECHTGYKRSYMHSMHWSRAAFEKACHHKMTMMKKHAM